MSTLAVIIAKFEYIMAGMLAGGVLHFFELQVGKMKFNFGKFIISSIVFGLLTEFSRMVIFGWAIEAPVNPDRAIVLSIGVASFLYLFVPFVLKEENRGQFVISVLQKFGFEKKPYEKK